MEDDLKKHVKKTGTLTVGIVCEDGIVLAADNRTTYGGEGGVFYIAGTSEKVHFINERIIATTAGTASDSRRTLKLISSEIRLKELRNREKLTLKEVSSLMSAILFQNIRSPSMIPSIAHFLIAGYDEDGTVSLYDASPDGYLQKIETYQATGAPFETLGILDVDYHKGMKIEQGVELAKKTFNATAGRQPGVGNGFDIFVIKPGKIEKIFSKKFESKFVDKN